MAVQRPSVTDRLLKGGGSILIAGALPVSIAWTAQPAAAAPVTSGDAELAHPSSATRDGVAVSRATPGPAEVSLLDIRAAVESIHPAAHGRSREVADATAPAPTWNRNNPTVPRPVPAGAPAPIDPTQLHLPGPVPPVAPIQAPANTVRIGSAEMPRPDWLDPQQAAQINDGAAHAEAALAQGFDSVGFAPSRSDRMAADTLGSAAIGGVVGTAVVAPLAITSAVVGGATGIIVGFPFAPAGLVFGPIISAAIGGAAVTVPAIAAGVVLGAGIGVVEGALAPGQPQSSPARSAVHTHGNPADHQGVQRITAT